MKKFIILAIALLLLVACTPKEEPSQPAKQASDGNIPVLYDSQVSALLVSKDDANLRYKFDQSPENPREYEIFIKGDKMKVILPDYNDYLGEYDIAYIDLSDESAVAYCTNTANIKCKDKTKQIEVPFKDVITKTPYDWLNEVPPEAKITGSAMVGRRTVEIVEYGNTKIQIEKFYKMPVKVESSGKTWNYELVDIGVVKDDDVALP
ncbi:MAG TPA: hypothetical protein VJC07_01495 [Candidatus Nanoarchaeia archaeon]|nr:hypothetical protein [Candidatus Nanoarchaeia archaeon]